MQLSVRAFGLVMGHLQLNVVDNLLNKQQTSGGLPAYVILL
jgi:hypothetical protein